MLLVLPPSESKHPPPPTGRTLELERLSFPELTDTRRRVLDALIDTSRGADALARLQVGPRIAPEVDRNVTLRTAPTRAAVETYSGPLYEALAPAAWSPAVAARAAEQFVIVSALFGALRPDDEIPTYRMHVCSLLLGLESLEPLWRPEVGPALDSAAGDGLVVDFRSPSFQAVGRPTADRSAVVRIVREDGRPVSSHVAKAVRGQVARHLLEQATADPTTPEELVDLLADRWRASVTAPSRSTRPWTVDVRLDPV